MPKTIAPRGQHAVRQMPATLHPWLTFALAGVPPQNVQVVAVVEAVGSHCTVCSFGQMTKCEPMNAKGASLSWDTVRYKSGQYSPPQSHLYVFFMPCAVTT